MALYEYHCSACNRTFTVLHSTADHTNARVACPDCRSTKVSQVLSAFYAKTVRKS